MKWKVMMKKLNKCDTEGVTLHLLLKHSWYFTKSTLADMSQVQFVSWATVLVNWTLISEAVTKKKPLFVRYTPCFVAISSCVLCCASDKIWPRMAMKAKKNPAYCWRDCSVFWHFKKWQYLKGTMRDAR